MADMAFLSAVLGTVSNEAGTLINGELKLLCGAKAEIESMKSTLSLIEKFLYDAETKKHQEESVKQWLHNLKEVAYDAQDLIDEAAAKSLQRKVAMRNNTVPIFSDYLIARMIKGMKERLEHAQKEATNLGLQQMMSRPDELLDLVAAQRPPRETSSTVVASSIAGRKMDLENLMQLLLSSESNNDKRIHAISIVGMGGLGKTSLAQLVYNDTQTNTHFDTKAWVYVSPKFNVIRLIRDILESISEPSNLTTLDTLQTQLGLELGGKRFLLVLDDVWNLDMEIWEKLCVPLRQAQVGSKILLTTRNKLDGTNPAVSMTSIDLGFLLDDECWSIVESFAFPDGRAHDHPRFEQLGQEIAAKAKGAPLAAKALGGILNSFGLDENRWRGILAADVSPLQKDIMPVLRLSYQYLPPHLKQCFAYCAVFPKGSVIDRDRLVKMWMALGFIQTHGNERMEDVGSDYFNALLGRSFFQYDGYAYSMHDLMHDLAQLVSEGECFMVEDGDLTKVPEGVRHLSLCWEIKLERLGNWTEFQKLRSLLFFCKDKTNFTPVLEKLFKKLKRLRVLDLNRGHISGKFDRSFSCGSSLCGAFCSKQPQCNELPSSIGSLKHLRYLHLCFGDILVLPESLGNLYNLQTLDIGECRSLQRLPKNMSNLTRLRHLKARFDIISNIDGLGKLTFLQELEKFSVGKGKGPKIKKLSDMNQIRGTLSISMLENVVSKEESMEARLDNKHYIDTLELEWSKNRDTTSRLDEQVLEGFKPHANLKVLILKNYGGVRCSGWMLKELPPFLETLHLLKCSMLEEFLPLEGQSFRCLRELIIHDCPELRRLPPLPPSLSTLELIGVGLCVLPEISGCPKINSISYQSSSSSVPRISENPNIEASFRYQLLLILALDLEEFNSMKHLMGFPKDVMQSSSSPSISPCSSLATLEISKCPNLRSLREGLLQQDLGALRGVRISDCQGLLDFPDHSMPSSIQLLSIKECPLVMETRVANEGSDWPKIAHIPYIVINGCLIK